MNEFGLVLAPLQAAIGDELDAGLHDEHLPQPGADRLGEGVVAGRRLARARRRPGAAAPASRPACSGFTATWPLTAGANELTTSRTADGNTLTPRTISMSSVRPTQRMRGPVRPHGHGLVRTTTWSRVRKRRSGAARCRRCVSTSSPRAPSSIATAAPDSGSISSAWTKPRAPRCIPSCSSHSPQSETPMSPMPIASVTLRAPALLEAARGIRARRRPARPRRARARRWSPRARDSARRGGRRTRASGRPPPAGAARSRGGAARCCPVPTGTCTRPSRSNDASAAPATNGPALYVETMRWPARIPEAA